MNTIASKLLTTAGLAITLGLASASAQTTIYRETFGNNGGGNISLDNANISWTLLGSATDGLSGSFTAGNLSNVSATIGGASNGVNNASYTGLANVNAGTSLSTTNGFAFVNNTVSFLAYTSEYTIDRSILNPATVTWNGNRSSNAQGGTLSGGRDATNVRFAAQIGVNWYVANYTPNASNIATSSANSGLTDSTLFTVDLNTATWFALTAANGAPISIAATATSLPSGNFTAFGLLGTSFSNGTNFSTLRFDNFEITSSAIPEPSTYAALAGFAVLGLSVLRRRRA